MWRWPRAAMARASSRWMASTASAQAKARPPVQAGAEPGGRQTGLLVGQGPVGEDVVAVQHLQHVRPEMPQQRAYQT
jgi:hypothetical protein